MTLNTLKFRAMLVFTMSIAVIVLILTATAGEAVGFASLVGSIGGLALLTWIAATVADAAVNTLKKEN